MREILFRGKRLDNGEWAYGMPCATERSGIYAIQTLQGGIFDIIQETAGQYTGLTDKNGTKLFEGDIIQTKRTGYKFEQVFKLVVKYGEYTPKDYCKSIYSQYATIGFYSTDGKKDFQLGTCSNCIEIIGNIHDNPELIGGVVDG